MRYVLAVAALGACAAQTPVDLARGKRIFEGQCAPCHGIDGGGGRGANLRRQKLRHAVNDAELTDIIQNGIYGTGMPGSFLTDQEAAQTATYVRSLAGIAAMKLLGDPRGGKRIFDSKGCAGCHIVNGKGSSLGPELSEIGARRSPEYLRQVLIDPGAFLPEGFEMVRVAARDGRDISGIRVNEDTFTIQIKDSDNRFHSFWKSDLKELQRMPRETPMPSYRSKLSSGEIDDLVAYLWSLR